MQSQEQLIRETINKTLDEIFSNPEWSKEATIYFAASLGKNKPKICFTGNFAGITSLVAESFAKTLGIFIEQKQITRQQAVGLIAHVESYIGHEILEGENKVDNLKVVNLENH